MVLEAVVGLGAGWVACSAALAVFGAHSVIEGFPAGVLLRRRRPVEKGGDRGNVENSHSRESVVGQSLLLLLAVAAGATCKSVLAPRTESGPADLPLAAGSAAVMVMIVATKRRAAARIGGAALKAATVFGMVRVRMAGAALPGRARRSVFGGWRADSLASRPGPGPVYFIVHDRPQAIQPAGGRGDTCACGD